MFVELQQTRNKLRQRLKPAEKCYSLSIRGYLNDRTAKIIGIQIFKAREKRQ